jgi:hypothetical protein
MICTVHGWWALECTSFLGSIALCTLVGLHCTHVQFLLGKLRWSTRPKGLAAARYQSVTIPPCSVILPPLFLISTRCSLQRQPPYFSLSMLCLFFINYISPTVAIVRRTCCLSMVPLYPYRVPSDLFSVHTNVFRECSFRCSLNVTVSGHVLMWRQNQPLPATEPFCRTYPSTNHSFSL